MFFVLRHGMGSFREIKFNVRMTLTQKWDPERNDVLCIGQVGRNEFNKTGATHNVRHTAKHFIHESTKLSSPTIIVRPVPVLMPLLVPVVSIPLAKFITIMFSRTL